MKTGRAILAVLLALGPAGVALAQENPVQFLERLMRPPVNAVTNAFRPPPARPKRAETIDLLSVPMPRLRPDAPGEAAGALNYAPTSAIEAAPLVPAPTPRPAGPPIASVPPLEPLNLPPPAARSICGAMIAQLGVEATPLAAVEEGACGISAPVAVASLAGGGIDFSTKAILECDLAEALARWSSDAVQPIALKTLGRRVTGYRVAASYTCRNRNSQADAKLSEHARGNAIDISAFKVDGIGWIEVGPGWESGGPEALFLKAVRGSACGPFTTVLGPGSDSYHSDHFHLDRAKRRTAGPSKGLYCK